jgi:hypothetical protein
VAFDPDSSPPTMKTLDGMYSLPLPFTVSFMNLERKQTLISVSVTFRKQHQIGLWLTLKLKIG